MHTSSTQTQELCSHQLGRRQSALFMVFILTTRFLHPPSYPPYDMIKYTIFYFAKEILDLLNHAFSPYYLQ